MQNITRLTKTRFNRSLTLLMLFAFCPLAQLRAGNPLGLTPGVWTTGVVLGSCTNLAAFNTSLNAGDISYSNDDLTNRTYTVRLPTGFDPNSTNKYGLITFIDANWTGLSKMEAWADGSGSRGKVCVGEVPDRCSWRRLEQLRP